MAGALNIQLEKPEFYTIGDNNDLSPTHIIKSLAHNGTDSYTIRGLDNSSACSLESVDNNVNSLISKKDKVTE